ncbi:hypothetical protein JCM10212_006933 [Sporobolomyces blumeae]
MPPATHVAPRKRLSVAVVAVGFVVFHLWWSGRLDAVTSSLRGALGGQGDDNEFEGGEGRRLYGIITLVRIGRLWSLCSAGIAAAGIYAIYRGHLSLLRLFTLNAILSIALDLLLLLLVLVLVMSSSSPAAASSRSIATTLCQILSTSSSPSSEDLGWWGLPDLLGLSLEQCEERFDGVVLSATVVLSFVEGLRAWAAFQLLSYYTAVAKHRNGVPIGSGRLEDAAGSGVSSPSRRRYPTDAGDDRYYDSPVELDSSPSTLGSSSSKGKHREREPSSTTRQKDDMRIFLLPRSSDDGRQRGGDDGGDVPLLSFTPSSPARTSFPPHQSSSSTSRGPNSSSRSQTWDEAKAKKFMVYAPIMMTAEEARQYGASELVINSRRTRSHSSSNATANKGDRGHSHSSSHSSRRSRSSTITPSSATSPVSPSKRALALPKSPLNTAMLPPPNSSSPSLARSSSSASIATTTPVRYVRHDSDDLPTPIATRPAAEIGIAAVLRGDLEDVEHVKKA